MVEEEVQAKEAEESAVCMQMDGSDSLLAQVDVLSVTSLWLRGREGNRTGEKRKGRNGKGSSLEGRKRERLRVEGEERRETKYIRWMEGEQREKKGAKSERRKRKKEGRERRGMGGRKRG
ncbi:hypothetical protein E2C01_072564 [Portunus trituberculatus]|uniref:Uncharacterized protein n=1 Tax=Portunus trituberculatus TaxID=210409 RepID=A0A5B7I862_PORTR|nr:hypothetical protein [Portunus trituberculatus]